MSVCCVPTHACFMTTPSNKALQMDPHHSFRYNYVCFSLLYQSMSFVFFHVVCKLPNFYFIMAFMTGVNKPSQRLCKRKLLVYEHNILSHMQCYEGDIGIWASALLLQGPRGLC